MGKIFTITEGLENMGALHTGGQGSVYKGKRIGEIYVAVKLLPTPIHAENENDKHYKDFINEVEKLKKVNEVANPNVVKILNSGITESGSLPFIEMEFIEGPDLAELLNVNDARVFTVAETIKVAHQLANALSHCHKVGVKHGDIKSNNVKFNINSGNYILLDFGLAIMNGEQRRSSLRNAGAVEFMAPEQSEGDLLPQSDVYSYGIILYELLAGTVPFRLNDNGQTARNAVMIAHLEQTPPNLLTLREQNIPLNWSEEQRLQEMQVPEWLPELIDKCLQKDPADRFADGTELYRAIQNSMLTVKINTEGDLVLQNEKTNLQELLQEERDKNETLQQEIKQLKHTPPAPLNVVAEPAVMGSSAKNASKRLLPAIGLTMLCVGLAIGHYLPGATTALKAKADNSGAVQKPTVPVTATREQAGTGAIKSTAHRTVHERNILYPIKKADPKPESLASDKKLKEVPSKESTKIIPPKQEKAINPATVVNKGKGSDVGKIFTLFTTYAYFHNRPDEASKRAANINQWNNARLKALDDQNGYIYVVYTNEKGQTSKGWLAKKDLIIVGQ